MNTDPDPIAAMRALCRTQTRLMVAENGAMMARVAAALTHELNTPLGTLSSTFQTLRSVLDRVHQGESIDAERAADLDSRLDAAFRNAMLRINEVVGRMQRVANLYGAETATVRIDELIRDVVALLDPELRIVHTIRLDLEPGLTAECYPQQISAVISALLHHMLRMHRGPRELVLQTSGDGQGLTISILAAGLVLSQEELACLLQPGLEASRCTWNVFSARQILLAHGGDLVISSTEEAGTQLTLTLLPRLPQASSDGQ